MLAIDDLEMLSVKTAWHRFNEDGGGMLERVVKGTGQHLSHARVSRFTKCDMVLDRFTTARESTIALLVAARKSMRAVGGK